MREVYRWRNYEEMRLAIIARRRRMGLSQLVVDEIAGLQSGYTAKIEAGARIKNLGPLSLTLLMGALGLEGAFVLAAGKQTNSDDGSEPCGQFPKNVHAEMAPKGGRIRNVRLAPRKRRQIARLGAFARWKKWHSLAEQRAGRKGKP